MKYYSLALKLFLPLWLFLSTVSVFGQWTQTGGSLYSNNNTWKIGIGNSNPQFPLDVTGVIHSSTLFQSGAAPKFTLMGYDGANSIIASTGTGLLINYNNGQDVYLCTGAGGYVGTGKNLEIGYPTRDSNTSLNIGTYGTTTALKIQDSSHTQLFTIASNGATMIDSSAPATPTAPVFTINGTAHFGSDHKLFEVTNTGTVYVRELFVKQNPFPDYVFEKNYPLKPLKELQQFVEFNKHLPNVPVATDVEKSGVPVAETQRASLEKIEEAYRYIFEINEKLEQLEAENGQLRNKVRALEDKGSSQH